LAVQHERRRDLLKSLDAAMLRRRVRIFNEQLAGAKVSSPYFGQNPRNSYDISRGFLHSGMWKFDPSEVSQPVRPSENRRLTIAEKPAIGWLLQFGGGSASSQFDGLPGKIVESLQRFLEIFPFSRDGDRRPGSI
jgi:hypothetical protein